jgi:hypothetical protein
MIRAVRLAIALLGAALLVVGIMALVGKLHPPQLLGLGVWLACAVILHDGVLVPLLTIAGMVMARIGRTVPRAVIVVAQLTFLVGAALSLATFPEFVAQRLGPRNPTVVPQNYAANLAFVWVGIGLVVAFATSLILWRARRIGDRQRSTSS